MKAYRDNLWVHAKNHALENKVREPKNQFDKYQERTVSDFASVKSFKRHDHCFSQEVNSLAVISDEQAREGLQITF